MYLDSHAHLSCLAKKGIDLESFFTDWEKIGGGYILDPGVEAGDLACRIEAGRGKPYILYAAGIWPGGKAVLNPEPHLAAFRLDAQQGKVVAIGECGLDYHWNEGGKEKQRYLFESQLAAAQALGKPVIIHSRDADADTVAILSDFPGVCGIIHCCPFKKKEALSLAEQGFYISFAGNLTYKNADGLRETAKAVPLDRLLVETDSPYLSPGVNRGKPNSPVNIPVIVQYLAGLREMDENKLNNVIFSNFKTLFSLC